jgi:hypothetical protein
MFVKLNDKLIINTDEVASVEEITTSVMPVLVEGSVEMSKLLSTSTGCSIIFKQGHKIEVMNATVSELWEIFNNSKVKNV